MKNKWGQTPFILLLLVFVTARAEPIAITDVTLIDGTGAASRSNVTVVLDGERISAIGIAAPAGARIVDGKGRFLIPGLWDMHVHWESAPSLALFIANGVTGTRFMFGLPRHLEWRKQIEEGALVGPRMVIAGRIVDGPKPFWKGSIATSRPEDGREAVQRTK